jgi:hypothetical protein
LYTGLSKEPSRAMETNTFSGFLDWKRIENGKKKG